MTQTAAPGLLQTGDRAQSGRPLRRLVTFLHRWFGLLGAVWLLGIALSGSVIAFDREIDGALNPDLFVASGEGPLAPLLADAQARYPGGRVTLVLYDRVTPGLIQLGVKPADGQRLDLYYDSGAARLNGVRRDDVNGLGRRELVATLFRLHYSFLGGDWLVVFLGVVALAWAITQLLALLIAFTSLRRWRDSFRVRRGVRSHKRNFDLHRALSLWLYPVTLMLAVSGVELNLPDQFRAAVGLFSPAESRFEPSTSGRQTVPALDMAAAAARFAMIAAPYPVTSFSFNDDAGLYRARMRNARDIADNGQRIVWISARDGRIVSDRHELDGSAGDRFIAWQWPLHSGRALGLPGRALISFTGLVIATAVVTGLLIWWRKRRQRHRVVR
jgi:uncharacterized iron-regulated membrane protein